MRITHSHPDILVTEDIADSADIDTCLCHSATYCVPEVVETDILKPCLIARPLEGRAQTVFVYHATFFIMEDIAQSATFIGYFSQEPMNEIIHGDCPCLLVLRL